jgi:hypothetical protein
VKAALRFVVRGFLSKDGGLQARSERPLIKPPFGCSIAQKSGLDEKISKINLLQNTVAIHVTFAPESRCKPRDVAGTTIGSLRHGRHGRLRRSLPLAQDFRGFWGVKAALRFVVRGFLSKDGGFQARSERPLIKSPFGCSIAQKSGLDEKVSKLTRLQNTVAVHITFAPESRCKPGDVAGTTIDSLRHGRHDDSGDPSLSRRIFAAFRGWWPHYRSLAADF